MVDDVRDSAWKTYAAIFDTLLKLRPYQDMLEAVLEGLAITPGSTLLDAGCGTGNLIDLVTRRCPDVACVGIDTEAAMLEQAKQKTRGVSLQQADLNRQLPFGDGKFNRIACTNALYTVTSPVIVLQELYRVLAPGGTLVITNPVKGFSDGWVLRAHCGSTKPRAYWEEIDQSEADAERLIREALGTTETAERMIQIRQITKQLGEAPEYHFFSSSGLCDLVSQAGFTPTQCTETYAAINTLVIATKEA